MAFDYAAAVGAVLADLARTLPELRHVDAARLTVKLARNRKRTRHGRCAKLVPGDGRYDVYVYWPRFHDQAYEDKLLTLVHELWHIGPACDGALRVMEGGAHGRSREEYDDALRPLLRDYLRVRNGELMLRFLELSVEDLCRSYGSVR